MVNSVTEPITDGRKDEKLSNYQSKTGASHNEPELDRLIDKLNTANKELHRYKTLCKEHGLVTGSNGNNKAHPRKDVKFFLKAEKEMEDFKIELNDAIGPIFGERPCSLPTKVFIDRVKNLKRLTQRKAVSTQDNATMTEAKKDEVYGSESKSLSSSDIEQHGDHPQEMKSLPSDEQLSCKDDFQESKESVAKLVIQLKDEISSLKHSERVHKVKMEELLKVVENYKESLKKKDLRIHKLNERITIDEGMYKKERDELISQIETNRQNFDKFSKKFEMDTEIFHHKLNNALGPDFGINMDELSSDALVERVVNMKESLQKSNIINCDSATMTDEALNNLNSRSARSSAVQPNNHRPQSESKSPSNNISSDDNCQNLKQSDAELVVKCNKEILALNRFSTKLLRSIGVLDEEVRKLKQELKMKELQKNEMREKYEMQEEHISMERDTLRCQLECYQREQNIFQSRAKKDLQNYKRELNDALGLVFGGNYDEASNNVLIDQVRSMRETLERFNVEKLDNATMTDVGKTEDFDLNTKSSPPASFELHGDHLQNEFKSSSVDDVGSPKDNDSREHAAKTGFAIDEKMFAKKLKKFNEQIEELNKELEKSMENLKEKELQEKELRERLEKCEEKLKKETESNLLKIEEKSQYYGQFLINAEKELKVFEQHLSDVLGPAIGKNIDATLSYVLIDRIQTMRNDLIRFAGGSGGDAKITDNDSTKMLTLDGSSLQASSLEQSSDDSQSHLKNSSSDDNQNKKKKIASQEMLAQKETLASLYGRTEKNEHGSLLQQFSISLKSLRSEIAEKDEEVKKLLDERVKLKASLSEIKLLNESFQKRINDSHTEIASLKENNTKLQSECDNLKATSEAIVQQRTYEAYQIRQYIEQLANQLNAANAHSEKAVAEKNSLFEQHSKELRSQEEKIKKLENYIEQLGSEQIAAQASANEKMKNMRDQRLELEALRQKCEVLTNLLRKQESSLAPQPFVPEPSNNLEDGQEEVDASQQDQDSQVSELMGNLRSDSSKVNEAKTKEDLEKAVAKFTEALSQKENLLRDSYKKIQSLESQIMQALEERDRVISVKDSDLIQIVEARDAIIREKEANLIQAMQENDVKDARLKESLKEKDFAIESIKKLNEDNERLRKHLLEVSDTHTQDLQFASEREQALRVCLREMQAAKVVTNDNQKLFEQKVKSLESDLRTAIFERDRALQEYRKMKAEKQQYATSLEQIQQAAIRVQRDEAATYAARAEILVKQKEEQATLARNLSQKVEELTTKLEAANKGLMSASRLDKQLEEKEHAIEELKMLVSEKEKSIDKVQAALYETRLCVENAIDRKLVKNLLISYFNAPVSKKDDVMHLISSMIGFNKEEEDKLFHKNKGWGWLSWSGSNSSNLSPSASKVSNEQNESFTEMFVKFLERESQPKPDLPIGDAVAYAREGLERLSKRRSTPTAALNVPSVHDPVQSFPVRSTVAGKYNPLLLTAARSDHPTLLNPASQMFGNSMASFQPIEVPKKDKAELFRNILESP